MKTKYIVLFSLDGGTKKYRALVEAETELGAHLQVRDAVEEWGAELTEIISVTPWDKWIFHDCGLTILPWND